MELLLHNYKSGDVVSQTAITYNQENRGGT